MVIEEIIDKTNAIFVDEFEVDQEELNPNAILRDALELDSLDYVDLVVAIESCFSVKLVADDFKEVNTLQSFYDLLDKKING
ncbi:MAG: phosphopantetheine-binding protein [Flavobacteriaceae bacterium]|nr:acyl carrier protein [Mangrovimonas sp.]MCB0470827.1 acyl carrier protein [Flavobacteriaceae bacterium]MCB0431660.1 acyl carrier protein [Mangrovimonas sp.]MCB0436022.1 acyl carrier protein [Mangrovimonas sp.]MCB0438944.1 acyl carrier protein [Mangrovimonas sp.]